MSGERGDANDAGEGRGKLGSRGEHQVEFDEQRGGGGAVVVGLDNGGIPAAIGALVGVTTWSAHLLLFLFLVVLLLGPVVPCFC